MQPIISIRTICPNCGSSAAERHQIVHQELIRTQCPHCDYLMVSCSRTNRIIEAYAPGIDALKFQDTVASKH
jgi:ribosomal protein S27AE